MSRFSTQEAIVFITTMESRGCVSPYPNPFVLVPKRRVFSQLHASLRGALCVCVSCIPWLWRVHFEPAAAAAAAAHPCLPLRSHCSLRFLRSQFSLRSPRPLLRLGHVIRALAERNPPFHLLSACAPPSFPHFYLQPIGAELDALALSWLSVLAAAPWLCERRAGGAQHLLLILLLFVPVLPISPYIFPSTRLRRAHCADHALPVSTLTSLFVLNALSALAPPAAASWLGE